MWLFTLQLMTEREPTKEQMVRYTYTDVVPYAGATCSMKKRVTATAATTYSKKPAHKTEVRLPLHQDWMLSAVSGCSVLICMTCLFTIGVSIGGMSHTYNRNSPFAYLAALQAARLATETSLVSPQVHAEQ